MTRKPKASDIDDVAFLQQVLVLSMDSSWRWMRSKPRPVFTWELYPRFPTIPYKVVLAKFRQLYKRKLLDGCPCGCRGDIEITNLGYNFLTTKFLERLMLKEDGREYYEHDGNCTKEDFTDKNESGLRVCRECAGVFDDEGNGVCVTDKRFDEPRAVEENDV